MNNFKAVEASWFSEIPEDWAVIRGKNLFKIKKDIAGELGHDVLSITNKGIKIKDIESGAGQLSMDYSKYQLVNAGDFAMNHMDLLTGYVDISKYSGVLSPDYRAFKLSKDYGNPKFFLYMLQLCYKEKLFFPFGQGSSQLGRWRLPTSSFNQFVYPLPPREEIDKIVEVLERELLIIDNLINRQDKLIKLLHEKKISLFARIVQKGLSKNVSYKNTKLEWGDEIPEHWEIVRVKDLFSIYGGLTGKSGEDFSKENGNSKFIVFRNVAKNNFVDLNDLGDVVLNEEEKQNKVNIGDLIVLMSSEDIETLSKVSCLLDTKEDLYLNSFCKGLRPKRLLCSKYFTYFLNSHGALFFRSIFGNGFTRMNIKQENVLASKCLLPPYEEQKKIGDFLYNLDNKYKEIEDKLIESTLKLKEKRISLIYSMITGKVRLKEK